MSRLKFIQGLPFDAPYEELKTREIFHIESLTDTATFDISEEQWKELFSKYSNVTKIHNYNFDPLLVEMMLSNFGVTEDTPAREAVSIVYLIFNNTFNFRKYLKQVLTSLHIAKIYGFIAEYCKDLTVPSSMPEKFIVELNQPNLYQFIINSSPDFDLRSAPNSREALEVEQEIKSRYRDYIKGDNAVDDILGSILK